MKNLNLKEGLKPREQDERDLALGAIIKWPKLSELPNEFWTAPFSIKDQNVDGNDDYCAACAGAGMIEPKEEVELFYPYLFAAAKYESKQDPDEWGLTLKDIGKALTKWGCPEVKDVPENIKKLDYGQRRRFENYIGYTREGLEKRGIKNINDFVAKVPINALSEKPTSISMLKSALKHKQQSYFFLDKSPYDPFDTWRAAKWYFREKKQHIMFGVEWGWGLEEMELKGTPGGFGHALWSGGSAGNRAVAINSAGKGAGQGGIHFIDRETFNHYAKQYGMLMFVDVDREEVETYYLPNKITLDDPAWKAILKATIAVLEDFIKILQSNATKTIGAIAKAFSLARPPKN